MGAALDVVGQRTQQVASGYSAAASSATVAGTSMQRTHRRIGEGVESISSQLKVIQGAYMALASTRGLVNMVQDIAQTAEQYANLQARISLVAGEGAQLEAAMQGVYDVAMRTHSALGSTGDLFARLATAGKDAGLSTQEASAQALGLAETINQAIQLSGASASASDAAITQLIQGLQGGALRGDEFNSVMEQSPRLARALADGLGVTTGELRKLAEAGALTSQTVIAALTSQADTVAAEFTKLPPTIGRSLQDLGNAWTVYVAETDKAWGASTMAARAIDSLARILPTVADALMDLGQASIAFAGLKLAQHFLSLSQNAKAAAASVAATNAQLAATGSAGAAAAVGVGRLASILATLRTFTLVGLIANFKDIATWVGEGIAKLQGFKDRTEEAARAEKLHAEILAENRKQRQAMQAALEAAINAQFELSAAANGAIASFQQLLR
ncbi:MAG: tape measure protein [Burkholderiaceae bacterium]|jgi:tape measure domain-containing protein|nr:tape measure protein [Burkholderiaceae bacterium]